MGWDDTYYWDKKKDFFGKKPNKTKLLSSFLSVCKLLDFNMNSSSKDYCCGNRTPKFENNKPIWESGWVFRTFYNKDGLLDTAEFQVKPNYEKHLFITLNKKIGLRKIPFEISSKQEKVIKLNARGCVNTTGLRRKTNSEILAIDIDKSVATRIGVSSTFLVLDKIVKLLKVSYKDFMLIEYNRLFDGGLHCYIKAPYELTDDELKRLEQYIGGKIGERVEFSFTKRILRLPFSYEYWPVKLDKMNDLIKLVNVVDFIPDDYFYSSFTSAMNSIKVRSNKMINCDFFKNHLYRADEAVKESLQTKVHEKSSKLVYMIREKPKFDLDKFKKQYTIKTGTSWEETKKLVPYLVSRCVSFDSLISFLQTVGKETKRYSQMSETTKKALKRFYDKCKKTAKVSKFNALITNDIDGYISNENYLTQKEVDLFHTSEIGTYLYDKLQHVIEALIDSCCPSSLKETCIALRKEKYKNELIEELPLFAIEFLGKYRWMKVHGVKPLVYKSHPEFDGLQMPIELMDKISEYVIKKTNPLYHKFNSKQFRVVLLMTFGLEMKQNLKMPKLKPYQSGMCAFWGNSFADVFEPLIKELENEFGNIAEETIDYVDQMTGEIITIQTKSFSDNTVRQSLLHYGFNLKSFYYFNEYGKCVLREEINTC